jgi:hypothetical protein
MEDLFRTIFEAFPEKSSIVFTGECSECGGAVTIEIFPTSGGFGLLGGALVEGSTENYAVKCRHCYKDDAEMIKQYKANPSVSATLDKKDLLSAILANHVWMRKKA